MTQIPTTTIERSERWQLKRLLSLAQTSGHHADFLPAELANRRELARVLTALCGNTAESGEALLSTTCARQTPLAALQAIKDLAKSLVSKATSEVERAAATLLYHAAVAAALVHHEQNISSRTAGARYALYEDLAAFMAGDALAQVFQEAADKLAADSPSGNPA